MKIKFVLVQTSTTGKSADRASQMAAEVNGKRITFSELKHICSIKEHIP
jgi:predicted Holliday junction resolvase-like endonuclease